MQLIVAPVADLTEQPASLTTVLRSRSESCVYACTIIRIVYRCQVMRAKTSIGVAATLSRLVGDDIFISYSRSDAVAYAAALANELSARGFSCYLDQWESQGGTEIPPRVLRRLSRSSLLVVVGSRGARDSKPVASEVAAFGQKNRHLVPISVDGMAERSAWFPSIAGAALSVESGTALDSGRPSAPVVSRIESSFRFTKRNARIRRAFLAAAVALLALVGLAVWQKHDASLAIDRAKRAQVHAVEAQARAKEEKHRADEATNVAKQRTQEAHANALYAIEQQRLADRQMRRARALELAATSRTAVGSQPDLAALLAARSFATADTFETRQALLTALSYRPMLEALLQNNGNPVERVWFRADGREVAAQGLEGIAVWPTHHGHRKRELISSHYMIPMDISANFATILYNGTDHTVHVSSRLGRKPDVILHSDSLSLALSPDETTIAIGDEDGAVTLWDVPSGKPIGEPIAPPSKKGGLVWVIGFDAEGKTLHWCIDQDTAGSVDIATRRAAALWPGQCASPMALSGDRNHVAFVENNNLITGRIEDGKLVKRHELLQHVSFLSAVAISSDGGLVAAGKYSGTLTLFDVDHLSQTTFPAHNRRINALAFSPDGSHLISGGEDGSVMLWSTRRTPLYTRIPLRSNTEEYEYENPTVRFTTDGKQVLATFGHSIIVIDAVREQIDLRPIECSGLLSSLAVHPDGKSVIAGNEQHRLFLADLMTRRCVERGTIPGQIDYGNFLTALGISPDGERVAAGMQGGSIGIWRTVGSAGKLLLDEREDRGLGLPGLNGPQEPLNRVNSVEWMPDGRMLVSGSSDGGRLLCSVERSKCTFELENPYPLESVYPFHFFAISRDGSLLAGSTYDVARVWNARSGREVATFALVNPQAPDENAATAVAISANHALLAVGHRSCHLSLFDVREKQWIVDMPVGACPAGSSRISSLDFSPNGKRLAAYVDGVVLLWHLDPEVWTRRALDLANRPLTSAEKRRFISSASSKGGH